MGCGVTDFLEGGVLKDSTIIGANITQSTITASVLDSVDITNLRSIDQASIDKIISKLFASDNFINSLIQKLLENDAFVAELVQKVLSNLSLQPSFTSPNTTQNAALPTLMYGDVRAAILGKPDFWAAFGDNLVPVYSPKP